MLPYSVTRGLVAKLRIKKMPLMFVPFRGGHEGPKATHAKAVAYFMGM